MLLIGYIRVSKADGSQVLDLQKDALLAAGVSEDRIYSDSQSGSRPDNRPGLINVPLGDIKSLAFQAKGR